MEEILDLLREYNEPVPVPLDLPDEDQLVLVEEEILLPIPGCMREYLLTASDVVLNLRTHRANVDGKDVELSVVFWRDGELTDDNWLTIWYWVRDVWLEY